VGTFVVVAILAKPGVAHAQSRRGSIEVGGGFAWTGGYGLGSAAANETRNPSTGSGPLTLFRTDSRMSSAPGVDVRAGVYLTSRLIARALFQAARPSLHTHATADFEGAPDVDAETSVSSYLIAGEVDYRVTAGRWVVFATGGAGQLREVPDRGDVLTAAEVHAGGGIRHALTHGRHPLDLRGDLVASYRSRTLTFDQHHVAPRATVGLTFRL
jgi:hypothetical protein